MTKLRKLFALLLVASMIFAVGCSTGNNTDSGEKETTTAENTDAVDAAKELGLDYTSGLEENGYFSKVIAKDLVELADYKNISIPSESHTVTDEIIQANIDDLMSNFTTTVETMERAVEYGDTVNIDYVGSVDEVEFEGGSTGGNGTDVTIGVTSYIDDFLEQLIGHEPGESFDIEVTFPEDYGVETLKGQDAVFAITINHIKETLSPELTDDFVAENFGESHKSSTLEELKTTLRDDLQERAIKGYLQNYVATNSTVIELPETLVEYQKTTMENYYVMSAASYGIGLEEFLKSYVGYDTMEAVYEAMADQITMLSETSLITQAIAEEADIVVTEENLSEYFLEYTGSGDYSEFETIYGLPYLKNSLLQDVVLEYLKEMVVLEE